MIYTFWEGEKPAYIELCMATWNFPFVELNYKNVNGYTSIDVNKLKPYTLPQIADCVRVHVLRDNGGTWLDADTIMLGDKLPTETMLGNPEERSNSIGFLNAEAGDEMFIRWAKFQDEILNRPFDYGYWGKFGNAFTDDYVRNHQEVSIGDVTERWAETYMIQSKESRMAKYQRFYFEQNKTLADIKHTDMLMLHNSWTPAWYKELTADQVLTQKCTLSNILKELWKRTN